MKALEKALEKYQFPWTVIADRKRTDAGETCLYDRFDIHAVPRGILVDRSRKIVTIKTHGEQFNRKVNTNREYGKINA
ncbi:MAG: hypothetical protein LBJ67_00615 [Planctomycetaceae bacterium]|nr:hypothetical protein [Planctomycetaceae bacterium]